MDHSVPPPEPAQGHELTTAANPHPVGRWSAEAAWHLLAALATVGVLVAGLRLDTADFHAPFTYEYDALLILPPPGGSAEPQSGSWSFVYAADQYLGDDWGVFWQVGLADASNNALARSDPLFKCIPR